MLSGNDPLSTSAFCLCCSSSSAFRPGHTEHDRFRRAKTLGKRPKMRLHAIGVITAKIFRCSAVGFKEGREFVQQPQTKVAPWAKTERRRLVGSGKENVCDVDGVIHTDWPPNAQKRCPKQQRDSIPAACHFIERDDAIVTLRFW